MVTITRTIHLFFKEYCVIYLAYPVDAIHGDHQTRVGLFFLSLRNLGHWQVFRNFLVLRYFYWTFEALVFFLYIFEKKKTVYVHRSQVSFVDARQLWNPSDSAPWNTDGPHPITRNWMGKKIIIIYTHMCVLRQTGKKSVRQWTAWSVP